MIIRSLVYTAALVVAFNAAAADEDVSVTQSIVKKEGEKPAGVATQTITIKAIVDSIDQKNRTAVLRSTDGKTSQTINISPDVKNLDQVKKGDEVTVEQVETLAIEVMPKGEAPSAKAAAKYVEVAKPGEKPRRTELQMSELIATVTSIDYKERTLTLTGPEGRIQKLKVGPEATRFDKVKKGDEVFVQHTIATAISVQKAEKK
ncbi:MAG: hypothetical protein L0Z73_14480 [Gammaproteobacteria bacterium]|nr:hypothetical protein [Gammaproteobacteria bacterium]